VWGKLHAILILLKHRLSSRTTYATICEIKIHASALYQKKFNRYETTVALTRLTGCDAECRCEKERRRVLPDVDLCLDEYLRGKNKEQFRNEISVHYSKQLQLAFKSPRVLNSGGEIGNKKKLS